MRSHIMRSTLGLCLLACAASLAPSGCGGAPASDTGTTSVESPIWNGTRITPSDTMSIHRAATVRLIARNFRFADGHYGTAACTGTLLRNDVVLTARHCIRAGELLTNSNYAVNIYVYNAFDAALPPTCNAWNCAQGATLVQNPDHDVALVFLNRSIWTRNSLAGHSMSVMRHAPELYQDRQVQCTGYGSNANDANGDPIGFGVPRYGWQELHQINNDRSSLMFWPGTDPYQLMYEGDSGGPCWSLTRDGSVPSVTKPYSIMSVESSGWGCQDGSPCLAFTVAAPAFRQWARNEIRSRLPAWDTDYYSPYSKTTAPYDGWEQMQPTLNPTSCPGAWGAYNGSFGQITNCYGTYPDGPRLMHDAAIVDNAIISTRVSSADNDVAGIVFRYVDEEHYYLYILDQERSRARMYKRTPAGFELLAGASASFRWQDNPQLQVYVYEDHLYGYVPGAGWTVSARDSEYAEGRIGLHTWGLDDAYFSEGINITHLSAGDQDWE